MIRIIYKQNDGRLADVIVEIKQGDLGEFKQILDDCERVTEYVCEINGAQWLDEAKLSSPDWDPENEKDVALRHARHAHMNWREE